MSQSALAGVWVSIAVVVIGFFLPWFSLSPRMSETLERLSREAGTVTIEYPRSRLATDLATLARLPRTLTGAQIPVFVRSPSGQLATSVAELLSQRRGFAAQAAAVYLVPALALACGVLVSLAGRHRALVAWTVAAACLALLAYSGWRWLSHAPTGLEVGIGIWVCVIGYAGLAVASGWCAASLRRG